MGKKPIQCSPIQTVKQGAVDIHKLGESVLVEAQFTGSPFREIYKETHTKIRLHLFSDLKGYNGNLVLRTDILQDANNQPLRVL